MKEPNHEVHIYRENAVAFPRKVTSDVGPSEYEMMKVKRQHWFLVACLAVVSGWLSQPEQALCSGLYYVMILISGIIAGFFAPIGPIPQDPSFVPPRRWILMGAILLVLQLPAIAVASMITRRAEGLGYALIALPIFCQFSTFLGMSLRTMIEALFRRRKT